MMLKNIFYAIHSIETSPLALYKRVNLLKSVFLYYLSLHTCSIHLHIIASHYRCMERCVSQIYENLSEHMLYTTLHIFLSYYTFKIVHKNHEFILQKKWMHVNRLAPCKLLSIMLRYFY